MNTKCKSTLLPTNSDYLAPLKKVKTHEVKISMVATRCNLRRIKM